jgi:hypothetical protein
MIETSKVVWDFSPKLQPVVRWCRRGHPKLPGRERCATCDRAREVAIWQQLKTDPQALAAHNAAAALRKAQRKRRP